MNTCGSFLEVFILKGLRSQKNRQNTAKRGVYQCIHSKRLSLIDEQNNLKIKKAAEGLPHLGNAKLYRSKYSTK